MAESSAYSDLGLYIKRFVQERNKPAKASDCLGFEVDGRRHTLKTGTVRNYLQKLTGDGVIERAESWGPGWYVPTGHTIAKEAMTPDPAPVSDAFATFLMQMPVKELAMHNIRFYFTVPGIWSIASELYGGRDLSSLQRIELLKRSKNGLNATVMAYRTDGVIVEVACSDQPVELEPTGIDRLSTFLTEVEHRLTSYRDNPLRENKPVMIIPPHSQWEIRQRHIGRDSIMEFSGPLFHHSYTDELGQLHRIYVKKMEEKLVLRMEIQESPKKEFWAGIRQKIMGIHSSYFPEGQTFLSYISQSRPGANLETQLQESRNLVVELMFAMSSIIPRRVSALGLCGVF